MVVAWSADHQHEDCTLSHDRQVRNPVYGQNLFRPNRKPATTRIPCSQPDQSAPTPTTNVGAKHFSPKSQPATPHTCSQPDPSAPTPPTNVRAKNISPRIATSNSAYPVRNPTRQPPHHLPTCGRKVFRPYNILPIRLIHGNDPTKVPHTASHRRRAMCWGCVAAPGATHLPCQINLNHNWR